MIKKANDSQVDDQILLNIYNVISQLMKSKYSPETLEKTMIKEIIDFNAFYYCLVKKQSELGFLLNPRLLIIQQSDFSIYYTKTIPSKPFGTTSTVPTGKSKLKISEVKVTREKESQQMVISQEKQKVKWKFIFHSPDLADRFAYCLESLQEKCLNFSISKKSKVSTKSGSSNYSTLGYGMHKHFETLNEQNSIVNFQSFKEEEENNEGENEKKYFSRVFSELKVEKLN